LKKGAQRGDLGERGRKPETTVGKRRWRPHQRIDGEGGGVMGWGKNRSTSGGRGPARRENKTDRENIPTPVGTLEERRCP